jgi:hypothetical protein
MAKTNLLVCGIVSSLVILHSTLAVAQNVAPLKLQFVDANDKPIVGVEMNLGSFVYTDNSGLSLAMNDLKTVDGGPLKVDSEGKVTVAIPDAGLGDLARFHLNAKHPGFADFNDWINVEVNKLNKITLPRGVRIAVTAVDADSGKTLVDNLYAIAEQKDLPQMVDWKSNGKGLLLSRPLRDTDKRIRLVELVDGMATRFSEPIDVPAEDGGRTVVSDIPMKRSLHFSGLLHRNVPRPVRNGMISICVTWPTEKELQETGPVGHWLAHAPVAEDGSFHVTGLPSGEWIQVIASCDGWFSEPAKAEVRQQVCPSESKWLNIEESILPNAFEFESSLADVVIGMLPTTSASIRFVDEMDRPFVASPFRAQRNQRFFHSSWYSREFRSRRSTAEELIAARNGKTYEPSTGTTIEGNTDERGVANVVSIPGPTFEIQLEEMLFEEGRIWKTIDLRTLNNKPIKVNRVAK